MMSVAMEFVLALARRNVQHDGGPFAAAIVSSSGELIAAGVNRVVSAGSSILHAEMLALMLAQQKTGFHDLSAAGHLTLVTSCAPCAMCLGAIPWSGVSRVVCGARGEDAESIGLMKATSRRGGNSVCKHDPFRCRRMFAVSRRQP
jgi:tRNA(Arg) A34 adenosine deaminase TadA